MPEKTSKRVLILGGGFAGLEAAETLEKIFSENDEVEITLVSKDNYLVFTSMLAEVVSSSIEAKHVVIPLRECLKKATFKELEVQNIDLKKKVASCYHFHTCETFE
ncbi:MAG: FAD-dependent oxidoreductase, partial [Deltaproteobacteria bacterium]|nr:FAD-dependent oxidoreductase [Deltaproteobacteria bacterium]